MAKRTHEEAMQTKDAILDAALKLFNTIGYEKTSLSEIAREAKVTRGAIYWHFEDKSEILCEVCMKIAVEVEFSKYMKEACDESSLDPLGSLRKWLYQHADETFLQFLSSILFKSINNFKISNSMKPKEVEKLEELLERRKHHVYTALINAIRARQLPINLDIEKATEFLLTIVSGYITTTHYSVTPQQFKEFVDITINALSTFTK